MARITIEDCLKQIPNRYELVIAASRRARQILRGSTPLITCNNRLVVTTLREIAQGKVGIEHITPNSEPSSDNDLPL